MKCDPSARGDTRRKILDLAEGLFLSRGFSALSYQQVSKVLGVRNAAIPVSYTHLTLPTICSV